MSAGDPTRSDAGATGPGRAPGGAAIAAIASSGVLAAYVFGGLVPVLPHIQQAFATTPGSGPLVRFLIAALAAVTGPPAEAPRNVGFARAAYYSGPLVAQGVLEPVVGMSSAATGVLVVAAIGAAAALVVTRIRIPYQGAAPAAA